MAARVLVFWLFLVSPALAGDARKARETGQLVVNGTAKGGATPALVAQQHERAQLNWKKLFTDEKAPHAESGGFLFYGFIQGKKLADAGAVLERTQALALKTLDLDEDPWAGKLAVYFVADWLQYNSFVRTVQRRRAEEGELGSYDIDSDEPHIVVAPPAGKVDLGQDVQAAEQLAAALMNRKNAKVVGWVATAFGRATAVKAAGPAHVSLEHRRAYTLVTQKKRTLKEVLGRGLDDDEAVVLRASFLEYLAYSGRTAKFMPFLKGFQTDDDMPNATVDAALKSANLATDGLNTVWQNWVKTLK